MENEKWYAKAWDWIKYLPVAYYDFIKNYPGRAAIVWPVTLALAIWLL